MSEIKILSCRAAQRYALRQRVVAAKLDILNEYPGLEFHISELREWSTIEPYTLILSAPSLVVNDRLVCEGRFPSREEVLGWVKQAVVTSP